MAQKYKLNNIINALADEPIIFVYRIENSKYHLAYSTDELRRIQPYTYPLLLDTSNDSVYWRMYWYSDALLNDIKNGKLEKECNKQDLPFDKKLTTLCGIDLKYLRPEYKKQNGRFISYTILISDESVAMYDSDRICKTCFKLNGVTT